MHVPAPFLLAWRDLSFELAGDTPELEFALRLLDTGVRWLEEHAPRILLELAPEERKLLRTVLGIEEGEGSEGAT